MKKAVSVLGQKIALDKMDKMDKTWTKLKNFVHRYKLYVTMVTAIYGQMDKKISFLSKKEKKERKKL